MCGDVKVGCTVCGDSANIKVPVPLVPRHMAQRKDLQEHLSTAHAPRPITVLPFHDRPSLREQAFIQFVVYQWSMVVVGTTLYSNAFEAHGSIWRLCVKREASLHTAGIFLDKSDEEKKTGSTIVPFKLVLKNALEHRSVLVYREVAQPFGAQGGCWGFGDVPIPASCYDIPTDSITFGALIQPPLLVSL